eukprot:521711-Alexandrium_andersonii.AAC.1
MGAAAGAAPGPAQGSGSGPVRNNEREPCAADEQRPPSLGEGLGAAVDGLLARGPEKPGGQRELWSLRGLRQARRARPWLRSSRRRSPRRWRSDARGS